MTGPTPPSRGRHRGLVILLAGLVAIVSLALVLLKSIPQEMSRPEMITDSSNATAPRPVQTAPPAAASRVHQALHDLGRICKPNDTTDQTSRAREPVAVVLDFARRYPAVSFRVHDETATTVSLLIVVRYSLRSCAPTLMTRVNHALPAEYQTPGDSR